ncbi:MAG: hypothetical protein ACLGJC_09775 [Alphaproteobacteria bacterium]
MQQTNLSRRAMLGGTAAACAVVAPIEHLLASGRTDEDQAERWAALRSMFSQPHPDAELLSAFHEANRLRDLMDGPTFGDEDIPDEVSRRYVEMVRKIAALPARTAEGVAAKLQTFTHEIQGSVYSYKAPEEDEGFFPKLIRTALEGARSIAPAVVA